MNAASELAAHVSGQLLRERRLCLVLDLDHTLLHTTVVEKASLLSSSSSSSSQQQQQPADFSFVLPHQPRYVNRVKLRPFARAFLAQLPKRFFCFAYTSSLRPYAEKLLEALDADSAVFGGRLVCSEERAELGELELSLLIAGVPLERALGYARSLIANEKTRPELVAAMTPAQAAACGVRAEDVRAVRSVAQLPPGEESLAAGAKRLLPQFGQHSTAIVVDNDTGAWRGLPNLVSVEPFVFFDCAAAATTAASSNIAPSLQGSVLSALGTPLHSLAAADNALEHLISKLEMLHAAAFEEQLDQGIPVDVASVVVAARKRVFSGCTIAFSGVIPLGAHARESFVWRACEDHGACCASDVVPGVTHLVATSPFTEKAKQALRMGKVKCVTPHWLVESVKRWNRAREEDFPLVSPSVSIPPSEISGKPLVSPAVVVEDDDDDAPPVVVEGPVSAWKDEVARLDEEVKRLNGELSSLRAEVVELKSLRGEVSELRTMLKERDRQAEKPPAAKSQRLIEVAAVEAPQIPPPPPPKVPDPPKPLPLPELARALAAKRDAKAQPLSNKKQKRAAAQLRCQQYLRQQQQQQQPVSAWGMPPQQQQQPVSGGWGMPLQQQQQQQPVSAWGVPPQQQQQQPVRFAW